MAFQKFGAPEKQKVMIDYDTADCEGSIVGELDTEQLDGDDSDTQQEEGR